MAHDCTIQDEVGLFPQWQNHVVWLCFPSGEQGIEPGQILPLFKKGFQVQKSRNAKVVDIHRENTLKLTLSQNIWKLQT